MRRIFSEAGYFFPKFQVDIPTDAVASTATLHINVKELGRPGVLRTLVIKGVSENMHTHVKTHAKLNDGQAIDAKRLDDLAERLLKTGRFLKVDIATQPHNESQAVDVIVTVHQSTHLPPLNEPLSDAQESMLKFAHWSQNLDTSKGSIHFRRQITLDEWGLKSIEVLLSPQDGISLKPKYAAGEGLVILKSGQLVVYTPQAPNMCSGPGLKGTLRVDLGRRREYGPCPHGCRRVIQ